MSQQGDVKLFQTNDGGNITVENGLIEMSGGLETMAYLCMFGGNENDDGRDDNSFIWWGNIDEPDQARKYRSETQHLLQSIPATTGNLQRINDAAGRDLAVFISEKIASSVNISVSIPALNRIKIVVDIIADGVESTFEYVENWIVES